MKRFILLSLVLTAYVTFAAPTEIIYVGYKTDKADAPYMKPFYDQLIKNGVCTSFRVVNGLDNLTTKDLAGAKVVVVRKGILYELTRHDRAVKDALVNYVEQGGGVIILNPFDQMFAHSEFAYQLMAAFGGRVLYEGVIVPKEKWNQIGEWSPDQWVVTTKVAKPFSEGVNRVLYRACYKQNWDHGVTPFLPGNGWKVALAAEADVHTEPFTKMGLAMLDDRLRKEGFSKSAPLVGYCEFGKGRVVWFGISGLLDRLVSPQDAANMETANRILHDGAEGMGSVETGRFMENLFVWAGANADAVDAGKLPRLQRSDDDDKALGTAYHLYRGVIGPRTTLSSGKSTPQEFIARAKKLGHDFIVFLEDFTALSASNYEKLRDICREASDESFTAWPGYAFSRDNGNCQFVFSTEPLYPGKKWLSKDGKQFLSVTKATPETGYVPGSDSNFAGTIDLEFFYGLLSFNNNRGWNMFHESPYRTTDNCNVQSMGLQTRINGRTAEWAIDAYIDNVQQGYQLWPITLEFLDSAAGITDDTFLTYCGANGLAEFRRLMLEYGANSGIQGHANFGLQSTSNGPEIEFKAARAHYAGDEEVLYSKEFLQWPYELTVRSANGLATIEMYDAGRLFRRWNAKGAKEFVRKGAFACEKQHYLWLKVTDCAGKVGYTRPADSHTFVLRENVCTDRNNLLFYSDQKRKDGTHMIGQYSAETALPNHILWPPRIKPVGYFTLDKKYGVGELSGFDGSPEDHPCAWLSPSIEYGGETAASLGWVREFVAGREGGPHCFPRRVVASSDALVGDRFLDGVLAHGRKPLTHGCQGLHPVYDSQYADTFARTTLFIPKLDGIIAYQWEQPLSFKQPIPSVKGKPIVKWGYLQRSSKFEYIDACLEGKRVTECLNKRFSMKVGDYIVIKNPIYGSLAVFPLAPVDYLALTLAVMGDGSLYQAGTLFNGKFVLVGMNRFVKDPYAFSDEIRRAYGIGETTAGYQPVLKAGRGVPNGVCFDAIAEKGVLFGRFNGLAKLPGTLGLRLAGLNDRQSVVVATPKDVRLVSAEHGVSHVALRDEESDCDLFVGHPFRTDAAELVLSLSKTIKGPWKLEVHNPTDKEISTRLTTDPRQKFFALDKELTIASGASVDLSL